MKHIKKLLFTAVLLLGVISVSNAAIYPFVQSSWDLTPNQVIAEAGMPAINKVDFDGRRITDYLGYNQTISGYGFTAYYNFNNERLFQVKLLPRQALDAEEMKSLAETLRILMQKGLIKPEYQYYGSEPLGRPLSAKSFKAVMCWQTKGTLAVIVIDSVQKIFEVVLADATSPANANFLDEYLLLGEEIEAESALGEAAVAANKTDAAPAAAQNSYADRFRAQAQPVPASENLLDKAVANWMPIGIGLLAFVIVVVLLVVFKRKKPQNAKKARTANRAKSIKKVKSAKKAQSTKPIKSAKKTSSARTPKKNRAEVVAKKSEPAVVPPVADKAKRLNVFKDEDAELAAFLNFENNKPLTVPEDDEPDVVSFLGGGEELSDIFKNDEPRVISFSDEDEKRLNLFEDDEADIASFLGDAEKPVSVFDDEEPDVVSFFDEGTIDFNIYDDEPDVVSLPPSYKEKR